MVMAFLKTYKSGKEFNAKIQRVKYTEMRQHNVPLKKLLELHTYSGANVLIKSYIFILMKKTKPSIVHS